MREIIPEVCGRRRPLGILLHTGCDGCPLRGLCKLNVRIKCPKCGRTQEVEATLYNQVKNGRDALGNPFHPFTCTCGDHIEMEEVRTSE